MMPRVAPHTRRRHEQNLKKFTNLCGLCVLYGGKFRLVESLRLNQTPKTKTPGWCRAFSTNCPHGPPRLLTLKHTFQVLKIVDDTPLGSSSIGHSLLPPLEPTHIATRVHVIGIEFRNVKGDETYAA